MGVVYLAEDLQGGGEVALKVLPPELAEQHDFLRRFQREASYASQLQHPNIVSVHDVGDDGGRFYIAMEYVSGRDLATLLASEGALEVERGIHMLSDVASALDALHVAGLLHRDVKPGNVLVVGADGPQAKPRCYLTDFGLAKNPTQDSVALTAIDSFVGTLDYVAPELMLNEEVDHRADVYSLACVLYECLAGQPPFGDTQGAALMRAHIQDTAPGLRALRPDLPAGIEEVVMRALAKAPADRFASCGELIIAARAALPTPRHAVATETVPGLTLTVTAGSGQGKEIRVDDEVVIGRGLDGDGGLTGDTEISRRHARIFRDPCGAWAVEDLGSTNGTHLNDARIEGSPQPLVVGDTLQLGGTALKVEPLTTPPSRSEPAPAESAERAARPPRRFSLRVDVDPGSGEVRLEMDESAPPIRLVHSQGRWRVEAP